jgi:predicted lipid-binding transport protein (Tim44 family)
MSQDATSVTDAVGGETDAVEVPAAEPTTPAAVDTDADDAPVDAGPGASESGFAVRFGGGFAAGMLAGGLVGVALDSLALAMFGGFILGTVVGIVLAARG